MLFRSAKLVDSTHDIVEELGFASHNTPVKTAAVDDNMLLTAMGYDAVSLDTLVAISGLSSEVITSELLLLELDGKITKIAGGKYQRLS